jgi:hypothetical protein
LKGKAQVLELKNKIILMVLILSLNGLSEIQPVANHAPESAVTNGSQQLEALTGLVQAAHKKDPSETRLVLQLASKAIDGGIGTTQVQQKFPESAIVVREFEKFMKEHAELLQAEQVRAQLVETVEKEEKNTESEKTVNSDPEKAKADALTRERLRQLEEEKEKKEREELAKQSAGQSGSGGGQGGGQDGGQGSGSGNEIPFGNSNNNQNNNQNSNQSDQFDKFLNRIGNSNLGLSNFSSTPTSSKKEDEKKNDFSLGSSKSAKNDLSLDETKAPKKPILPPVQSGLNDNATPSMSLQGTGTPEPLMAPWTGLSGATMGGNTNFGANGSLGGMGGGAMGGGAMMNQNQASLGSLGNSADFPFSVTGEPMEEGMDGAEGPRFRTVSIPMGGSSGAGEGSASGETSSFDSAVDTKKSINRAKGIPQYLYLPSLEEQSLKNIPGIFRSLASGYKKSRVQKLCSSSDRKLIGVCQRLEMERN